MTNTHAAANKPVTVGYRTISIAQAVALPLTAIEGNQVKVVINYNIVNFNIEDESLVGWRINAVTGIYDRNNGSLIRLSSFPNGFVIKNTEGTTQLETYLTDPATQNISAIVTITSADKTEKYSNDVIMDLDLKTIPPTTLPALLEDNISPSQTEVSIEDDEESSSNNGHDSEAEEREPSIWNQMSELTKVLWIYYFWLLHY